jgi:hypothetical protein
LTETLDSQIILLRQEARLQEVSDVAGVTIGHAGGSLGTALRQFVDQLAVPFLASSLISMRFTRLRSSTSRLLVLANRNSSFVFRWPTTAGEMGSSLVTILLLWAR